MNHFSANTETSDAVAPFWFVRVGSWGDVVACSLDDSLFPASQSIRRGNRVICRTARGLEVGVVTAVAQSTPLPAMQDLTSVSPTTRAARILRKATVEDELLIARLDRYRIEAMEECRRELAAAGSQAVLLDVDQLFDAGTLVFYFMEPLEAASQSLVERLASKYESRVRSGHFAKLVAEGCGAGCGTKDAHGGGCSKACAICVVAKSRH